jgi:hypothetical protein
MLTASTITATVVLMKAAVSTSVTSVGLHQSIRRIITLLFLIPNATFFQQILKFSLSLLTLPFQRTLKVLKVGTVRSRMFACV